MSSEEKRRREAGIVAYQKEAARGATGSMDLITMAVPTVIDGTIKLTEFDFMVPTGPVPEGVRAMGNLSATVTALALERSGGKKRRGLRWEALMKPGKDGQPMGLALLGGAALLLNKPSGKAAANPSTGETPVFDNRRGYAPGEVVQWQGPDLKPVVYVAYGYNAPGVTPATVGSKYTKLAAFPFDAGTWDPARTYAAGEVAGYKGGLWVCVLISLNNVPDVAPAFWAPMGFAMNALWFSPDGEVLQRDPLYRQPLRQSATLGADPPPIISTAVSTAYDSIDVGVGAGLGAGSAQVLSSAETAAVGEEIRLQRFGLKLTAAGSGTGIGAVATVTVPYSKAFLRTPDTRIVARNATAQTKGLYPVWSADSMVLTIFAGVDPGASAVLSFDVILTPQN